MFDFAFGDQMTEGGRNLFDMKCGLVQHDPHHLAVVVELNLPTSMEQIPDHAWDAIFRKTR